MSYFGNITTNKRNNNYIINSNAEMSTAYWATYSESDSVTFTDAGDLVTLNNHGLSNGTKISFTAITSTTGISVNTTYYVISATTNTFQVSSSSGGSALPLTTNGSGTMVRSVPKTGTGGSPSISWISSGSSTALRQYYEFLFANVSGNSQGQGVKTDFKIDPADQAKVLTISFDYSLATATGTYANGDLVLYIIADPNGTPTIIQPAGYTILSGSQGTYLKQIATFQTLSNCVDYRLCIHVATPSTGYQLKFDNFIVGPQTVQYGAPVTDWVSYTPTGTWTTNTAYTGKWRRVGDSMEVSGRVTLFGAPTPIVSLTVNLPSGFSIDTNKLTTTANPKQLGLLSWFDVVNSANQIGFVVYSSTTAVLLAGQRLSSASNHDITPIRATVPKTFTTGDEIDFTFSVPILGWSSTVQMSNDTDTRVVAASYSANTTQALNAATVTTLTLFGSKNFDTHSAFDSATGIYTIPTSGVYDIDASWYYNSTVAQGNGLTIYVTKNGSIDQKTVIAPGIGGTVDSYTPAISYSDFYNAGDTIRIRARSTNAITIPNNSSTQLSIKRRSGPSAMAATETVALKYKNTAGTTLGATATIPFATRVYDTHGAYNGTVFTAPISGTYLINATLGFNSVLLSTTQGQSITYKVTSTPEGLSAYQAGVSIRYGNGANTDAIMFASKMYKLNAGDTVEIQAASSVAVNLATANDISTVQIVRVGN